MRIAVNARLLVGQRLEGMGLYTLEVLKQLLARRPSDDFLLVCDRPGPLPDLPRAVERVTVGPPARHPLLFWAWFELSVPRALRRWGAEAFVSLENFCSLRAPTPTLLVVHDLAYRHVPQGVSPLVLAYYRRYMPRFVRRAEALVTVSEATRRDVSEAFGVPADRIAVAYNGVRARFGRLSPKRVADVRQRLTGGAPYFVYVGAVHTRKNVDGLVRAFTRFKAGTGLPHRLVIAGRMAWQTGPVAEAIAASPVREHVVATGYLEEDELGEVIGAADALALVSLFEGFGVPVVEAFACGVPVLVSDRSSLPEVAGPGGLTVDPTDEGAVARGLARLATNDDLRRRLAEAAARHAERFTWARAGEVVSAQIDGLGG